MSRTESTAPLRVQAWTLPAWSTVDSHSRDCVAGGPCTLDRSTDEAGVTPWGHCSRHPRYFRGRRGGVRRFQHTYANQAERRARTHLRSELRRAVTAANSARLEHRHLDELDDIDIDIRADSISRLIW